MLDKILNKILNYLIPVRHVEDIPPGTIIDRVIDPHTLPSLSDKERLRIKEDLKNHGLNIDLMFQERLKKNKFIIFFPKELAKRLASISI
mgnify:CR=1 FL=1